MVQIMANVQGLRDLVAGFNAMPDKIKNGVNKWTNVALFKIQREAQIESPVAPKFGGTLRDSIFTRALGLGSGYVSTNTDYAAAVHEGTVPHIIRPKNKKALFWEGADHPVKVVYHPGTSANKFMFRGYKNSIKFMDSTLDKMLNEVIK